MTNEQKIFSKLIASGMTIAGVAGVMGNLYAESALDSKNLQNTYEKSLGYTDEEYTDAVDSGKYTNFIYDSAGYGFAQWTYHSRKKKLLSFAKAQNTSIGDSDMQLNFLIAELKEDYAAVWKCLCSVSDVKTASDTVMTQYECPADVSATAKNKRYEFSKKYYEMFASTSSSGKSVSELAQEVLDNKWGTGEERKSRLTAAGYDYDAVQKEVNELLKSSVENTVESVEKSSIDAVIRVEGKMYSGTLIEE